MRNLKRALSLALASVMVLGMMVVGAGAVSVNDFSDGEKIVNKEAVSVLTTLNVINGKDDGSYDPEGTVTRAEMAKMICVILNGGKDPSLGNATTNTFTDTVGHWASPYIEYCTKLGIISGRGDGTFDPNGNVTGSEAAKMLLAASGYQAAIEGFTGANWEIATNVRANQVGLYDDVTIAPSAQLNRDNAAQMVYNTLDIKVVTYKYTMFTDGSTITSVPELQYANATGVKDITVLEDKFSAVKVEGVVIANEVANLESTSEKGSSLDEGKTKLAITNGEDQKAYSGKETFSTSTGMDELGRAVTLYVKKNSNASKADVLGSAILSTDNKVVLDNSKDPIADVADDNDLDISSDAKVAVNYGGLVSYSKYTDPKTAGIEKLLIDTDDDGGVDYILMNTYSFGKVTTYTASGDGNITVSTKDKDGKTTALSADKSKNVVGFDDVAKNDYVLAAYIGGDLHVAKADSVSGTLEAYKGAAPATKLTVDGTDYNVSNVPGYTGGDDSVEAAVTYGKENLDNEATYYLDKNGYIVAVGDVNENAYNYALVMATGTSVDERVKVALSDGTTGTYDLNSNGLGLTGKNAIEVGGVYAYSVNAKKEIKLTAPATEKGATTTEDAKFTKGKTSITGTDLDKTYYANSNTVFFYTAGVGKDANGNDVITDVDIYTGFSKAPTLDAKKATVQVYVKGENDRVMAVVFTGKDLTTTNVSDNLYIHSVGTSTSDYTNAKAFIAGSSDSVAIKVSSFPGTTFDGKSTDVLKTGAYTFTIDSDGNYELEIPDNNLLLNTDVYSSHSSNVVFGKTGGKTELSITSKTLLVNDSEYLSDPVAELGAGPDEGDEIAFVIYNKDGGDPDEALLIVVKNDEDTDNGNSHESLTTTVTGVDEDYIYMTAVNGATDRRSAALTWLEDHDYTLTGSVSKKGGEYVFPVELSSGLTYDLTTKTTFLDVDVKGAKLITSVEKKSDLKDGDVMTGSGAQFNEILGTDDITATENQQMVFAFKNAEDGKITLNILDSKDGDVYTESADDMKAGTHFFYIDITEGGNNAGSGSLKDPGGALKAGAYSYTITLGEDDTAEVITSGSFTIG